jgi:hypothetical protein
MRCVKKPRACERCDWLATPQRGQRPVQRVRRGLSIFRVSDNLLALAYEVNELKRRLTFVIAQKERSGPLSLGGRDGFLSAKFLFDIRRACRREAANCNAYHFRLRLALGPQGFRALQLGRHSQPTLGETFQDGLELGVRGSFRQLRTP